MNEEKKTCKGCIWVDQCESDKRCEDYTPVDVDEDDVKYYNQIIKENTEENIADYVVSDRRMLHLKCPHCGEKSWNNFRC